MNRRNFLRTGAVLTLLTVTPVPGAAPRSESPMPEAFPAFLDTLLPSDSYGPSASELGIVEPTWKGLTTFPSDRRFMQDACRWLDNQGNGHFSELSPERRRRLVAWMAERPAGNSANVFYHRTRNRAVMLYYRDPDMQARLGLTHPPQPRGFIQDFQRFQVRDER